MIFMIDQKTQKYLDIYKNRKFEPSSIFLTGDSAPIDNNYFLNRLHDISKNEPIAEDYYSLGGAVEELENHTAKLLGKESAVFFPTGTMANHIAIRKLCGISKRAVVQEQSHIYQDSGDTVQTLSGINLIPLGNEKSYFSVIEYEKAIHESLSGRVKSKIGAVSIESPVRRCSGQQFPYETMKLISSLSKSKGISMHLDGARLFMMSGTTGIKITDYTKFFDSVYVSLWKYFDAPFGAILAGSENFCKELFHDRRMFGGSLPSSSIAAALALKGMESFPKDFKESMNKSLEIFQFLDQVAGIDIRSYENGTNIFKMILDKKLNPLEVKLKLAEKDIFVNPETLGEHDFDITINTTILRKQTSYLKTALKDCLT